MSGSFLRESCPNTMPVIILTLVCAAVSIMPTVVDPYSFDPTTLIRNPGPELTQKHSIRCACFCVMLPCLYSVFIPTAPTGNPPTRLNRMVMPASLGRLNSVLVTGERSLPALSEMPYITENDDRNIKGNSDGTSTFKQQSMPSAAPLLAAAGFISIPVHTAANSSDTTASDIRSVCFIENNLCFKFLLPFYSILALLICMSEKMQI